MLRVGLTGGVGSGKSTVAAILRSCGAYVSSSDEIGRTLMQPGQKVFAAIVDHFGRGVLTHDGVLDRPALARIAFEQGRAEELNAIVHPAVIAEQQQWVAAVSKQDADAVAVVESALIFETRWQGTADAAPWRTRFDRMVVVTASVDVRRKRYIQRLSGSVPESEADVDFTRRAAAQWTDEQKCAGADFVLNNDGTTEQLRSAVEHLYWALREESMYRAAEAM